MTDELFSKKLETLQARLATDYALLLHQFIHSNNKEVSLALTQAMDHVLGARVKVSLASKAHKGGNETLLNDLKTKEWG